MVEAYCLLLMRSVLLEPRSFEEEVSLVIVMSETVYSFLKTSRASFLLSSALYFTHFTAPIFSPS